MKFIVFILLDLIILFDYHKGNIRLTDIASILLICILILRILSKQDMKFKANNLYLFLILSLFLSIIFFYSNLLSFIHVLTSFILFTCLYVNKDFFIKNYNFFIKNLYLMIILFFAFGFAPTNSHDLLMIHNDVITATGN